MAVYQATNKPAVSLPNGASSLPLDVLPLLERFDKVYLWMDHDGAGQAGVDKFVQKLVRKSVISPVLCLSIGCAFKGSCRRRQIRAHPQLTP